MDTSLHAVDARTHKHRNQSLPERTQNSAVEKVSSQVCPNQAWNSLTLADLKARSSVKKVTSSDELWEMVVIFCGVKDRMVKWGCGLPLPHISHFRGWNPRRGPNATSIKPPLILIHFVVSRELLLIKCVPDCIMGVSQGLEHEANSPHYSNKTRVWTQRLKYSRTRATLPDQTLWGRLCKGDLAKRSAAHARWDGCF